MDISIPECLSVTWYESISGEELQPYRKLNCHAGKDRMHGYHQAQTLLQSLF